MKILWFFTAVVFPVLFEVSHQCSSSSYDENEVTPINCKYFYQSWTWISLSKLFVVLFCESGAGLKNWKNSQNGVVIKRVFYNHPSKLLPPHKGTLVGPKCQDTLGVHLELVCMGLHESLVFSRGQIFIKIIHPKCSKFPFSWTWN